MRAWAVDLFAAWRGEAITVSSPMPLEVTRQWLSGPSLRAGDVVRRAAAQSNTRNSWRPVLRGRLLRTGSGSEFVGVLGWDPVLKALTGCLLGACTAILLTGLVLGVSSAAQGGWRAAGPGLATAAFGLFGVLTALASTVIGYREARGQTAYLRSWIMGQMNAPWYQDR